jgi:hypothetical protein
MLIYLLDAACAGRFTNQSELLHGRDASAATKRNISLVNGEKPSRRTGGQEISMSK